MIFGAKFPKGPSRTKKTTESEFGTGSKFRDGDQKTLRRVLGKCLLGNGRNTVSRVLFRKKKLTEFCAELGEFWEKLGEFALAYK